MSSMHVQELFEKYQKAICDKNYYKRIRVVGEIVKDNQFEILKYFMEHAEDALDVFEDTLVVAVENKNYEIIKRAIGYIKENKSKYNPKHIDSAILFAIQKATELGEHVWFSADAVKLIKHIMDCYCD